MLPSGAAMKPVIGRHRLQRIPQFDPHPVFYRFVDASPRAALEPGKHLLLCFRQFQGVGKIRCRRAGGFFKISPPPFNCFPASFFAVVLDCIHRSAETVAVGYDGVAKIREGKGNAPLAGDPAVDFHEGH